MRVNLDRLERLAEKEAGDPVASLDEHYQQGYRLVLSKQAQRAFDVHSESDRVRDTYGRNPFGQRALLARRLVEAGVPFITLYEGGWDHHTKIFPSLKLRLPTFDQTKKKFLNTTGYWGQQVEMDGQGRLLLPQLLRDAAQLKGEVAVVGLQKLLEIRNLEAFRKQIEDDKFTPEDEKKLSELGI